MHAFRVALAQINTTVGDLDSNTAKTIDYIGKAKSAGANLVAFPELTITGYPPEDLVFKHQFINDNLTALDRVVEATRDITAVIGFVDVDEDIYNAAAIAHQGKLAGTYHKMYLPNYSVFDEERYFRAGNETPVFMIDGVRVGINVCEDLWWAQQCCRQRRERRLLSTSMLPLSALVKQITETSLYPHEPRIMDSTFATSTSSEVRTNSFSTAAAWYSTQKAG